MKYQDAKKIMGKNFLGPDEIKEIAKQMGIEPPTNALGIPYNEKTLKKFAKDHLLILGVTKMKGGSPLTLNNLRAHFGLDPTISEPCFYNQDWYVKERFATRVTLKPRWYLLRRDVKKETRGERPDVLEKKLKKGESFPSAILTAYAFFAYYFLTRGKKLWNHDFIWCSDRDKNGDRIYTGRYEDPKKINKNGFNVHRHLSIRPVYGAVTLLD